MPGGYGIATDVLDPFTLLLGGKPGPNPTVNGVNVEPVNGSQDSLTQFTRSLGNTAAEQANSATGTGTSVFGSGVQSMQPAINFFQKLLGSNEDLQSALGPQFDQISQQFDQIRNSISATQPRGGGTASSMVQAPFQEAAAKGDIASKARTSAASDLGQLSATEAGLGLSEQGLGAQDLSLALQEALGRKGLNIQETANTTQMLSGAGEGIGQLLGAAAAGG